MAILSYSYGFKIRKDTTFSSQKASLQKLESNDQENEGIFEKG